jgi:hypothetical protein
MPLPSHRRAPHRHITLFLLMLMLMLMLTLNFSKLWGAPYSCIVLLMFLLTVGLYGDREHARDIQHLVF